MSSEPIQLIVGLGNPGKQYEQTRHNAGFWFVESLVSAYHGQLKNESKFQAEIATLDIAGHKVWAIKPNTFVNLSGQAVTQAAHYYKIEPESILVIHDELDLEPGTIKLKKGGGHGGHNGLRDVCEKIGKDYWRLRVGIGHPGDRNRVSDYVLSRPGKVDEELIEDTLTKGLRNIEDIIRGDSEKAMQDLHTK